MFWGAPCRGGSPLFRRSGCGVVSAVSKKTRGLHGKSERDPAALEDVALSIFEQDKFIDYERLDRTINDVRRRLDRPLTLSEKILYGHMDDSSVKPVRGQSYLKLRPDRVAMQDATAQMAVLQFIASDLDEVMVPTTIHCDHLIEADKGREADVAAAVDANREVYDFLSSAAARYGMGFWKPNAGIIHQVMLENYAFPGGLMIGTDSHMSTAGGLGMLAAGVGGAEIVDVMAGQPWEVRAPRVIGVRLTGKLGGWTSPKDVILRLLGLLTTKGGTDAVIEYFGPGVDTLTACGMGTICNMGAELGATSSVFPYTSRMHDFLVATGRANLARASEAFGEHLCSDEGAVYDEVIELDLSSLEPQISGPFSPDRVTPLSEFADTVRAHDWPDDVRYGLIGSCTNSSYEDLQRTASVATQALNNGVTTAVARLLVSPGSEMVRRTVERDGIFEPLEQLGGVVLSNSCGPCIGNWRRNDSIRSYERNSIITSFNRNFTARIDGNPRTHAFVASPEIATALAIAGRLTFNPVTDSLTSDDGAEVFFDEPDGYDIPPNGFFAGSGSVADTSADVDAETSGEESDITTSLVQLPPANRASVKVVIDTASERLQVFEPFAPWWRDCKGAGMTRACDKQGASANDKPSMSATENGKGIAEVAAKGDTNTDGAAGLRVLLKVRGKCTTDHISAAGPWLKYRGHLANISNNLLVGAVNADTGRTNEIVNRLTGKTSAVPDVAAAYKAAGVGWVVIGEENYGEGSSREHAALEPRFLGGRAIIAKSFARIHETNLKKQGMLALTFADPDDYDRIGSADVLSIEGLDAFAPQAPLSLVIEKNLGEGGGESRGCKTRIVLMHSYNAEQIEWFKAGCALNYLKATRSSTR